MSGRTALKIVLPIVVLILGVASVVMLASARQAPQRTEHSSIGPLVEAVTVTASDQEVRVAAHGEIGAKVSVEVVPEVAGRVVEVHPSLVAGGFFSASEPLFVIESRDYELAVERARAAVARARVVLEQEQAEAEVARSEWDELHPGQEPASGLVVREPQVRQVEAELEAARADLAAAELNLERTRVSVPFDGIVVAESVDPGLYVSPGRAVATVYGTAAVEIRVPLEDRELAWFEVPRRPGVKGPRADVSATFAGDRHLWQGQVVRLEGQVDPRSRMVHVVVEVLSPFARSQGRPPLLPGTFVDVSIHGRVLEGVIRVPRHAVHEGNTVWVIEGGRLRIREVEVARSDFEWAYVSSGLAPGTRVVVSAIDAVTDGMDVRTENGASEDAAISEPEPATGGEA